ncbi:hypothetical protein MLD38_011417 [Melastoma candidum]|uniref:Uncharacterized protein n=1 Tax=Melastoma candidum TaxID=119954 RepID=A0ACB9R2F1_9MYRT|nr:hypothetical protein MLD38_011417 [Melastoma candidum]
MEGASLDCPNDGKTDVWRCTAEIEGHAECSTIFMQRACFRLPHRRQGRAKLWSGLGFARSRIITAISLAFSNSPHGNR